MSIKLIHCIAISAFTAGTLALGAGQSAPESIPPPTAASVLPPEADRTIVYDVRDLTNGGTPEHTEQLRTLVLANVNLRGRHESIHCLNGNLIVTTVPPTHDKVTSLLAGLRRAAMAEQLDHARREVNVVASQAAPDDARIEALLQRIQALEAALAEARRAADRDAPHRRGMPGQPGQPGGGGRGGAGGGGGGGVGGPLRAPGGPGQFGRGAAGAPGRSGGGGGGGFSGVGGGAGFSGSGGGGGFGGGQLPPDAGSAPTAPRLPSGPTAGGGRSGGLAGGVRPPRRRAPGAGSSSTPPGPGSGMGYRSPPTPGGGGGMGAPLPGRSPSPLAEPAPPAPPAPPARLTRPSASATAAEPAWRAGVPTAPQPSPLAEPGRRRPMAGYVARAPRPGRAQLISEITALRAEVAELRQLILQLHERLAD